MRSSMAEIQGRGTVDLTPGLVAWADPVRLRQIIRNLLSNRTRYGGPGHRVSTRTEGEMVLIEVADDGPPIPEDRREAIFLPFESGHDDRPSDSAGLGLSVARDLARAMGGDLVYDHAGGYSILTVSLPLHAAATVGPPADILSGGGDSVTQDNVEEYDDELVGLLELVWGDGFLAPGGPESVARTVAGVDLTGRKVLDVGCGVGGADLVLSSRFGARVTGLDVEPDLIERARRNAAGEDIHYVCAPPGPLPFPNGSFDHVFTHAAIIHVPDKRAMFSEIMRVLRPGGWLLAYDWLKGSEPFSADMLYWFELEGLTYVMDDLDGYLATLTDVGFVDVTGEDDNLGYRAIAHQEYERMRGEWHQRITDLLGPDRRDHFIEDWRMLTVVLDNGELRPGYFRGRKPPA
jgi:phosphoethanolamine N-methyltransferase